MKDISDETITGIASILLRVRIDEQIKLNHGSRIRSRLRAQLKAGEKVSGYRAEWLLESRNEVVTFLGQLGARFNEKYPHDRVSTDDMNDICASVIHYFKKG